MKNIAVVVLLALVSLNSNAQKLNEYKAINGIIYHPGDSVKLGSGSGPNGTFVHLQLGGWGPMLTYDTNGGPDQLNIERGYANTSVIIKKIKRQKIKGVTMVYFVVGGGNVTNYNLTIDDAISACEVLPCPAPKRDSTNHVANKSEQPQN